MREVPYLRVASVQRSYLDLQELKTILADEEEVTALRPARVAEVSDRLSIIAAADTQVDANLKRAARLRQCILKRAFEGRLVPQDPTDEPAEKLLERIKAEGNATISDSQSARTRRSRRVSKTVNLEE